MRTRSTWQGNGAAQPRQAATRRQADIYKMNQEHPDAGPIDYENGDPDSWAESWHGYGDVEQEYEGGHVKRNELNFAEMLDTTYKHKDSDHWHSGKGNYDNVKDGEGKFENQSGKSTGEKAGRTYEAGNRPSSQTAAGAPDRRDMAERKAAAVERVVRAMLRTSNEKLITDVAVGYMGMPDRVVVATLRALDAVSPDALTPENKMRRALACTKLAARLLGDSAGDKMTETLASTLMTIDDPTLKSVLKQLAAAHVAQEQEDDQGEEGGKQGQVQVQGQMAPVGQQQEEDQQGGPPMPPAVQGQQQEQQGQQQQSQQEQAQQRFMQQQQQGQQQQEQQGQQQMMGQEQEDQLGMPKMGHGDLPPAELQMLDQMLKEEMAGQGAPAGDDLTALFEAAPAPAAPVAPVMASAPGMNPEISFDDDEEEMQAPPAGVAAAQVAAQGDELDSLFGDNDEVMAQRQIKAAELEQQAREGGFAVQAAGGRVASSRGAKKIGQVQRGKAASVDTTLESLWDRP